jgi:predicted Zn-ribbon and HTH transcriptional regulator
VNIRSLPCSKCIKRCANCKLLKDEISKYFYPLITKKEKRIQEQIVLNQMDRCEGCGCNIQSHKLSNNRLCPVCETNHLTF